MILLVMLCQALVYKEVTALFNLRDRKSDATMRADKRWRTAGWTRGRKGQLVKESQLVSQVSLGCGSRLTCRYFFAVANYFLYGESIIYYFKHIVFVDAYFIPFARNHRFISFMLYTVGKLTTSISRH